MVEIINKTSDTVVVGVHAIGELTGCDPELLDNEAFLKDLLEKAAVAGGGTVIQTIGHSFKPQGVTVISLLAESHISIHTWPERAYAAVDAFTCGSDCKPELSIENIAKALKARGVVMSKVERGEKYE